MSATKSLFEHWDGKTVSYRFKSLALKADLSFSYQFDDDRFMAAAKLEVTALGKSVFSENRSSRYFTTPKLYWSDFTVNGKIITAKAGGFDLCLLPLAPNFVNQETTMIFLNDWKAIEVNLNGSDIKIIDRGTTINLTSNNDKEIQAIKIDTKIKKNIILERV